MEQQKIILENNNTNLPSSVLDQACKAIFPPSVSITMFVPSNNTGAPPLVLT